MEIEDELRVLKISTPTAEELAEAGMAGGWAQLELSRPLTVWEKVAIGDDRVRVRVKGDVQISPPGQHLGGGASGEAGSEPGADD